MESRTEKIQAIFENSWFETIKHYDDLLTSEHFYYLTVLRTFLLELQDAGFDKEFRIGTSMHNLIISRSVAHGLRSDQKRIHIESYESGNYDINFYDFTSAGSSIRTFDKFTTDQLSGNERLLNNLNKLRHTLVD